MRNSVRLIAGLFLSVALASAAAAQEPARRRPQQIPPTGAEEATQLTPAQLDGIRTLEAITSRSTAGLTFDHRADGTIGLNLQGRFQNVLLATPGKDGKLEVACLTGDHGHEFTTPIAFRNPVRGETRHRLQAPTRLAAPIRVASVKTVAPEVK